MATLSDVVKQLKVNNTTVEKTNNHLENYFKSMERSRLDQLEALRESGKGGGAAGTARADGATKESSGGGIAVLMAGIAALVGGFFSGLLDSVKAIFKLTRLDKAFAAIKNLFTGNGAIGKLFGSFKTKWLTYVDDVAKFLKSAFAPITNIFKPNGAIGKLFLNMRLKWAMFADDAVKMIDNGVKPIKDIFSSEGRIAKLFKAIIKPFTFPFEGFIDNVAKPFKMIFDGTGQGGLSKLFYSIARPFETALGFIDRLIQPIKFVFSAEGPIGKVIGVIKNAFSILDGSGPLMKLLGGLGTVLGKLFLPVTIIMTAWDTIKEAMAGYEEGGIIGALEGAWRGLLNSLVGVPLDLLKSAVSWIAGKMGFSEAEKMLDSFSFVDLISKAINGVFSMFKSIVNGLLDAIASAITAIPLVPDKVGDVIRGLKFDMEKADQAKEPTPPQLTQKGLSAGVGPMLATPAAAGMSDGVGPMLSRPSGMQNGVGSAISNRPPMTGIQNGIGSVLNSQRQRTQAAGGGNSPTVIAVGGNSGGNVNTVQATTQVAAPRGPARDTSQSASW